MCVCVHACVSERDRETEGESERQRERQTDRERERERERRGRRRRKRGGLTHVSTHARSLPVPIRARACARTPRVTIPAAPPPAQRYAPPHDAELPHEQPPQPKHAHHTDDGVAGRDRDVSLAVSHASSTPADPPAHTHARCHADAGEGPLPDVEEGVGDCGARGGGTAKRGSDLSSLISLFESASAAPSTSADAKAA